MSGGTVVPRHECPGGHFFQGDSHASDRGEGGGQLCLGNNVRHGGGTFIPRHQCPGGQSCLGMNVRGDTFSRGTAMPPTPVF